MLVAGGALLTPYPLTLGASKVRRGAVTRWRNWREGAAKLHEEDVRSLQLMFTQGNPLQRAIAVRLSGDALGHSSRLGEDAHKALSDLVARGKDLPRELLDEADQFLAVVRAFEPEDLGSNEGSRSLKDALDQCPESLRRELADLYFPVLFKGARPRWGLGQEEELFELLAPNATPQQRLANVSDVVEWSKSRKSSGGRAVDGRELSRIEHMLEALPPEDQGTAASLVKDALFRDGLPIEERPASPGAYERLRVTIDELAPFDLEAQFQRIAKMIDAAQESGSRLGVAIDLSEAEPIAEAIGALPADYAPELRRRIKQLLFAGDVPRENPVSDPDAYARLRQSLEGESVATSETSTKNEIAGRSLLP
jgi:hypothetical protein